MYSPIQKLLLTAVIFFPGITHAADYHLYYLGGQFNMDGYGLVDQLPQQFTSPQESVMIFQGSSTEDGKPAKGLGIWRPLRPGHGADFRSDGQTNHYGTRFGCELSFATELRKLRPNENVALIKYSRGGTSIAIEAARYFGCWDPDFEDGEGKGKGINQYDHFLATLRNASSAHDIDGDGENDRLIPSGILWMQGESDAGFETAAKNYANNLKRLMDLTRAALRTDDLPIAIGRISDSKKSGTPVWQFGEILRSQQKVFCDSDSKARLIKSTDMYGYSDPWHYDTESYIDLGRQFARAIHELRNED